MSKKILLVTLVHNRKQLIPKAIQSVVNQTLAPQQFDYLLFDNNSSDGSEKIIDIFAKKYDFIHAYHYPENLGQQKAYNKILNDIIPRNFKNADAMCILDDDDELFPHALFKVNRVYSKHSDIGGTYSDFSIINDYGRTIVQKHSKAVLIPDQHSKEGQKNLKLRFLASNPCGHFRNYRILALQAIGGFPEDKRFATDYAIFGMLMEKFKVIKIDDLLYKFRQHGFGQVQSKHSPEQTADYHYYQKYFKERWAKMGLI